jgi:hypothetical protein
MIQRVAVISFTITDKCGIVEWSTNRSKVTFSPFWYFSHIIGFRADMFADPSSLLRCRYNCSYRLNVFNVHGSVHRKNIYIYIYIYIYIQQDASLHNLFYLETTLHALGGTTTHHQERKQLYLQRLVFVTPLPPHSTLKPVKLFHDSGR